MVGVLVEVDGWRDRTDHVGVERSFDSWPELRAQLATVFDIVMCDTRAEECSPFRIVYAFKTCRELQPRSQMR